MAMKFLNIHQKRKTEIASLPISLRDRLIEADGSEEVEASSLPPCQPQENTTAERTFDCFDPN